MSFSPYRSLFAAVFVFGAILAVNAESQRTAMNSIYAEGLGPALAYSLNYERLVINDLGVRVGWSYLSFSASASSGTTTLSEKSNIMSIPFTASYLGISSGKHALELGGGMTFVSVSGTSSQSTSSGFGINLSGSNFVVWGNILAGYRIHPENGGFQFRIGFCGLFGKGFGEPTLTDPAPSGFQPWFYISLGGCF